MYYTIVSYIMSFVPIFFTVLASFIGYYCVKFFAANASRALGLNPQLDKKFKILCIMLPLIYLSIMKIFKPMAGDLYFGLLVVAISVWGIGIIIGLKVLLDRTLREVGGVWNAIFFYCIGTIGGAYLMARFLIRVVILILY